MPTPDNAITIPLSLSEAVWVDPERLGGVPAFRDTRVPVQALFDYLRAGKAVADFFEDFPGVTREQVSAVLDQAASSVVRGLTAA